MDGVVERHWWHCVHFGVVKAVFMDFRWSVNILRVGISEEQDGAVVGVSWPVPSGVASVH